MVYVFKIMLFNEISFSMNIPYEYLGVKYVTFDVITYLA